MPGRTNWIRSEMARVAPHAVHRKGIDLDGDGRIERRERIATFNNNRFPGNNRRVVGDWADWLAFYRWNWKRLAAKGGLFALTARFKPDNPIHMLGMINAPLIGRRELTQTYRLVAKVVAELRLDEHIQEKPPREKLIAIYKAMESLKITGQRRLPLWHQNMSRIRLDPASASFVVLAVAHEMEWPVRIANSPDYIFPRWDDGRVRINIDEGRPYTDAEMARKFKLSPDEMRRRDRVYLRSFGDRGFVSLALRYRSEAYLRRGDGKNALRDIRAALALNKRYVRARNFEGVILSTLNRHREAIASYRAVTRLNPSYAKAWYNLGVSHCMAMEYDKAIVALDRALVLRPGYRKAHKWRGIAKFRLSRFDEAAADFAAEMKRFPRDAEAVSLLGRANRARGRLTDAVKNFTASLKIEPSNWEAHYYLARTYFDLKDMAKAITHIKETSRLNPKKAAVANYNLGVIYYMQRKYPQALVHLNKAITLADENYATALFQRGLVKVAMGRYGEALVDFVMAKEKDINLSAAVDNAIKAVTARRVVRQRRGGRPRSGPPWQDRHQVP